MNLNQLQYFKVLAKEEHYTKAAEILNITQPSLSHSIRMLEQEMGVKLFEKRGRNVVLTKYGKSFLPYVENSLSVLKNGIKRTKMLNSENEGEIHLAYIYTLANEFVPKLVRKFLDANPDLIVDFYFTVGTTGDIIKGMKKEKYDVVFSSFQEKEQDVDFWKIGNQKLVVVVPKGHPLAHQKSVDLEQTIKYPQIYFSRSSGLRPVIDQLFQRIHRFPEIAYEMEEDSSMAGLVAQNFGIAIMPDIPILKNMDVEILEIASPEYERAVYLSQLKNHYQAPVVRKFIEYVLEETSQKK